MYTYALRRLGTRADAEDVTAETFARAQQQLDRFEWRGGAGSPHGCCVSPPTSAWTLSPPGAR
ncbi:MAG: sigma factor [Bacillota bacterium]